MTSARLANPRKLIERLEKELKKEEKIKPTEWSKFVKSGSHKIRPPYNENFWYTRSASLLRRIYIDGPVGVEKLRRFYGGRKKMGHKPARSKLSGGNHLRKILQQLEKVGYISMHKKGGRKITSKGMKFMDNISKVIKDDK